MGNTLTRSEAISALDNAGWPFYLSDIMVAIGAQESSLHIDAQGPTNANGTIDYGWLQVNSQYVTGPPKYDIIRLLADPVYNARCAYAIFKSQGLAAWVAYTSGDYKKYLPPHMNGPLIAQGSKTWFLVADLQDELNKDVVVTPSPLLVVDGSFGPKTLAALKRWQIANPLAADGVARPADTLRLIP